jgi:hypothetical protein
VCVLFALLCLESWLSALGCAGRGRRKVGLIGREVVTSCGKLFGLVGGFKNSEFFIFMDGMQVSRIGFFCGSSLLD